VATCEWRSAYLRLHPRAALKRLENPYVYHIGRDELYEIDDRAQGFLTHCDGTHTGGDLTDDATFVEYCLSEGLLEALDNPDPVNVPVNEPVNPSLRYLELQLLHKCNLRCLHCYLGPLQQDYLSLTDALEIAREFSSMGGLRLLISGGEPLLYRDLTAFLAGTEDLRLRRVLLSNGTLITPRNIDSLKVEEIQFSLDGWAKGHDMIRGDGTFERTMRGIRTVRDAGIAISVATMIHRGNLHQFERMRDLIEEIGAIEWGIDAPVLAGSFRNHPDLFFPYEQAAPLLAYAFGGGYHGSSDGYACGRHLLTVFPDGRAAKCGFYRERPLGDARQGLKASWLKLEHIPLSRLECGNCQALDECAGGCRFRASGPLAPDPVMCARYGAEHNASPTDS
jgi:radical SAM protein with 4Fe4S-binding SPASM domain